MSLIISRAKPNPRGKDTSDGKPKPEALAGEWIDIQNVEPRPVDLSGLEVLHRTAAGAFEQVVLLSGVLKAGNVMRLHSGKQENAGAMRYEDKTGADIHVFTGADRFVWNNGREGDAPTLWHRPSRQTLDQTSYDGYPPEGQVLVRVGAKLVVSGRSAVNY